MAVIYPDLSGLTVKELMRLALRESEHSPVVKELTARFTTPRELAEATFSELTEIKGLGPGKASSILAALELAKRLYAPPSNDKLTIRCPQDIVLLLT
ncbi:hypothetical protein L7E55_15250 [Pelotomaculum isophthalicicum JI]|uniref:DNA repair protein RadC n=1 Tax=Pelotomaculum isophthalicicum JI TaxID=947010 RepID=A0A9X4H3K5_9FIRM|nr:hypothetical protein [Pelotomaculum isophthalicicum]MDF9409690.1 hypothetical protein [Pelotomaculum isophthalicicum JI]